MKNTGHVLWMDLTVEHAAKVKDFYAAVVGWQFDDTPMSHDGEAYHDYTATSDAPAPEKSPEMQRVIAGVCHAKGGNADAPAQWISYVGVADLDKSLAAVTKHGGKIVTKINSYGQDRYVVIQDPAGASLGLYEQG